MPSRDGVARYVPSKLSSVYNADAQMTSGSFVQRTSRVSVIVTISIERIESHDTKEIHGGLAVVQ